MADEAKAADDVRPGTADGVKSVDGSITAGDGGIDVSDKPSMLGDQAQLEFVGLMQQFLDSNLQPAEVTAFNDRLRSDPDSRSAFVRCLTHSSFLEEQLAQDRASESLPPDHQRHAWVLARLRQIAKRKRPLLKRKPTWRFRPDRKASQSRLASIIRFPRIAYLLGGLAAAAVLLGFFLVDRTPVPTGRPPASFVCNWTDGIDCQWNEQLDPAQSFPVGRELTLTEGSAELEFGYGARAVISAPARVEVTEAGRMILWNGSAVCHVPESAVGFIVDTPSIRVVDLGTEFGIATNTVGKAAVYVFQGKVRVEPPSARQRALELTAGSGAVTVQTKSGFVLRDNVKVDPSPFRRDLEVVGD